MTHNLIDMIKWIDSVDRIDDNGWKDLEHIQQISDRDVIEYIFILFQISNSISTNFIHSKITCSICTK